MHCHICQKKGIVTNSDDFCCEYCDETIPLIHIQIFNAIQTHDFQKFISLFESNNFEKSNIFDFLKYACQCYDINIVRFLLDHDFEEPNDINLLVIAICGTQINNTDTMIIQLLLEDSRFDVNKPITSGTTPLIAAFGRTDIMKLISEHKDINMNYMGKLGTPFYVACLYGMLDGVKFLIEDPRVDPNTYVRGQTAFHYLCCDHRDRYRYDNGHIVEFLANHPRIDIYKLTEDGKSAVDLICGSSVHRKIVEKILLE